MTDYHDYNEPDQGAERWHVPLNENFRKIDADVEIRDTQANRSDYEPKDGAKYFETDTGDIYLGDGTNWNRQSIASGAETSVSDDGAEVVKDVTDIDLTDGYFDVDNPGGAEVDVSITDDSIDTPAIDLSITPTWTGQHRFDSGIDTRGDIVDDTTTVWDSASGYLPQSALENDSLTVTGGDGLKNGGSVSLGASTTLNIEPADFAGTHLSDDGSDNLTVDDDFVLNTGDTIAGDLFIDDSGEFTVGDTSSHHDENVEVVGTGFDDTQTVIAGYSDTDGRVAGSIQLFSSRGTTLGSKATVQDGDRLGTVSFRGIDADNNAQTSSLIRSLVEGSAGSGSVPSNLLVSTTDGSGNLNEALRLDSAQDAQFTSSVLVNGSAGTTPSAALEVGSGDLALTGGSDPSITDGSNIRLGVKGSRTLLNDQSGTTGMVIANSFMDIEANSNRPVRIRDEESGNTALEYSTAPSLGDGQLTVNAETTFKPTNGENAELIAVGAGSDRLQLELRHNTNGITTPEELSLIQFTGPDSNSNLTAYGRIRPIATTDTDGSEDGRLEFETIVNGSPSEQLRLEGDQIISPNIGSSSNPAFTFSDGGNSGLYTVSDDVRVAAGGNNIINFRSSDIRVGKEFRLTGNTISEVGGTADANSGSIRLANEATINARNSGNDGDIRVLRTNNSDKVVVGGTNASEVVLNADNGSVKTFSPVEVPDNSITVESDTGNESITFAAAGTGDILSVGADSNGERSFIFDQVGNISFFDFYNSNSVGNERIVVGSVPFLASNARRFGVPTKGTDPTNATDGDIWYRSDLDEYRGVEAGTTVSFDTTAV